MPSGEGGEAKCIVVQDEVRVSYHSHRFCIISLTSVSKGSSYMILCYQQRRTLSLAFLLLLRARISDLYILFSQIQSDRRLLSPLRM
jgi:hypothetical protein